MFRSVTCASAAALAAAGAAPQGGNYRQFLDQWAGGSGHLASTGGEGGRDDKLGAGGGSFDYSQYMSGGQGAQAKTSSATALGSFDYSKYMGGASGGSSMMNSSGYSGYMKNYNMSSSAGGADYNFSSYVPFNYSKYTEGQQKQTAMSATDCHDISCLKAWREARLSQVDKYSQFAPKVGQDAWSDQIQDQYETNKKRIQMEDNATMISHPVEEPWWLIHGVTPEGLPKAEGGAEFSRFSPAQQEHFGVNAKGEVQDQAKFDKAIAAVDAEKTHKTSAASTEGETEHSKEERSKAASVTMGERNHSKEAATAKVVEVNATAAARDPLAVGAVSAAPAEALSTSPVEESRGVDLVRWVVLGSVMLVAVGMAVRAARARPVSSLPEEDPNQAYLALA